MTAEATFKQEKIVYIIDVRPIFWDVSTKRDRLTRLCVDRDKLRKEQANKQTAITELHKVTNKLCYAGL